MPPEGHALARLSARLARAREIVGGRWTYLLSNEGGPASLVSVTPADPGRAADLRDHVYHRTAGGGSIRRQQTWVRGLAAVA